MYTVESLTHIEAYLITVESIWLYIRGTNTLRNRTMWYGNEGVAKPGEEDLCAKQSEPNELAYNLLFSNFWTHGTGHNLFHLFTLIISLSNFSRK